MAEEGFQFTKKAYDAKTKIDNEMDDLVKHFHRKYIRPAVSEKYYCLAKCQESDKHVDTVRVKPSVLDDLENSCHPKLSK